MTMRDNLILQKPQKFRKNYKPVLLIMAVILLTARTLFAFIFFEDNENFILPQSQKNLSDFIQGRNLIQDKNQLIQFFLTEAPPGLDAPYGRYNYLAHLTSAYMVIDKAKVLKNIIDNAIKEVGIRNIEQRLSSYSLGMGDLRSLIILLVKSPYYQAGRVIIPEEKWQEMSEEKKTLHELALQVIERISFTYKEIFIRLFNTLTVEPDIKTWPKFEYINYAFVKAQKILEGKVNFADLESYREEIQRAVIAAIAGFNYETDMTSLHPTGKIKPEAIKDFHNRIEYWLKSEEFVPKEYSSVEEKEEKFRSIKEKAIELFNTLKLEPGLFPTSPWRGEIAEIYQILGGNIPTQADPGKLIETADWGEDIYKRLWDISQEPEKVESGFGILLKGPEMLLEQLKEKLKIIGPALVGLNTNSGKQYIRVMNIISQGGKEMVIYQNFEGKAFTMDLKTQFIPLWDKFVYIPEDRSVFARVISDFDVNPGKYSLIKGYGQWTINEFDFLKSDIGTNINIPLTDNLPYFYSQYRLGGEKTYQYAGYYQSGWWLSFQEEIKKNLLRGSALVFDAYISDNPKIKYVKIELKEDETGKKIAEYIIPREKIKLGEWNIYKIPIHYYLPGTLVLSFGVIGAYPDYYSPKDYFVAVDRIYLE